jgi:tRNA(Ile)-lysidine synthase
VAELERSGLAWVEDPTNRDPKFLRNRIRHGLLPLLATSYEPDVVDALVRVARLARAATDALEEVATAELDRLATWAGDAVVLPLDALRALPRPVAVEALRGAAARLGSRAPLRAWAHRGLARLAAPPAPRRPFRLGGLTAEVSSGRVRLARGPAPSLAERVLVAPGRLDLPEIGQAVVARIRPAEGYRVPTGTRRVAFDADGLPTCLTVRARRRGDRLTPFGGGERRLKTLLIGAGVPRWERGRLPVVEAAGTVLWVAGLRRSAAAPITAGTRRVLELDLVPLAP